MKKGVAKVMERNIMQDLIQWKDMTANRMPLVLYGVRQVGKTYILQELGDRFHGSTYLFDIIIA